MYKLSNSILEISILDPIKDNHHFGSRYCTGGYIWQVHHKKYGALLSGPQYPKENPDTFDGQGAPDAFESAPFADEAPPGDKVLVPGVGIVKKTSPITPFHVKNNLEVMEYCIWNVVQNQNSIVMNTIQNLRDFRCEIRRTVSLTHTTVTSKTEFTYNGFMPFTLRWFAHPFFPLNKDNKCCSFSIPVSVPENHAFCFDSGNVLSVKSTIDRTKSPFTLLNFPQDSMIAMSQYHPQSGLIQVIPDFKVSKMPVWKNDVTFSFEPYLIKTFQPGESVSWGIDYKF